VAGLVDDIVNGVDGNCPLEGAKEALEDGAVWSNSAATPDVLLARTALSRILKVLVATNG
jgi:hypothetical protein